MDEKLIDRELPKAPKVKGNILRLKAAQQFTFLVNSSALWHTVIHWCGRSLPHLKDSAKCVGCMRGFPTREVWYLHVYTYERHCWEFLELPEGACREFLNVVGHVATFKGVRFLLKRKKGDKAHLTFDMQVHNQVLCPNFEYPPEEDPDKLLKYLWGMNGSKLRLADTSDLAQGRAG